MKVCYVAGPYRAATEWELAENIHAAEAVCVKYTQLGYAVICPHKNFAHMGGVMPDQFFLDATLELMRRSDVVVMLPTWHRSAGARAEHAEAQRLKMRVAYEVGPVIPSARYIYPRR